MKLNLGLQLYSTVYTTIYSKAVSTYGSMIARIVEFLFKVKRLVIVIEIVRNKTGTIPVSINSELETIPDANCFVL